MKKDKDEYYIVTEVGNFGSLGTVINDPTATKVDDKKKKKKTMEELIEEAIKENSEKL